MKRITLLFIFMWTFSLFGQNDPTYCIPTYEEGCEDEDTITQVRLLGEQISLDNSTGCSTNAYGDYTDMPGPDLLPGETYTIRVKTDNFNPYYRQVKAWIDYNQDGTFTEDEEIANTEGVGLGLPNEKYKDWDFTVPANLEAGDYRMRVRMAFKNGNMDFDACNNENYGETEDYTVSILPNEEIELPSNFSEGIFIYNEGSFGSDPGSLNFIDSEGNFHENVYQSVNGHRFGNTGSFATIFADKLFAVSKQANSTEGGRLVVADALTLEELASFENLNGGDGRSFVGVNAHKAYVGADNGIYVLDLDSLELGEAVEGSTGNPTLDGQIGGMIRTSQYVFAVRQIQGILVIAPNTDEVIETIEGYYHSIVQAKDGSVWATMDTDLVKIDPISFETTSFEIPTTTYLDTWGAWNAGSLTASLEDNALYWINGEVWTYDQEIIKFDVDTESFDEDFALTPGEGSQTAYGAGMRVNPHTNQLVMVTTGANFDYGTNWIHFLDNTGSLLNTIEPEDYYWFPTLPFFPDTAAPVVSEDLVTTLAMEIDEEIIIDLKEMVSDADNNNYAIVKYISTLSEEGIVEALINTEDELILTATSNGEITLEITFDSNGKEVTHDITITVGETEETLLSAEDVVFFVGEGDQTAYVLVDFRDGTPDASFAWGVHFNEGEGTSILDTLTSIQEEDENFSFDQAGGFLNDILYNHHSQLAGEPDWWSTWDGESPYTMEMNMGISGMLSDGNWYGFSYGFTPEPVHPSFDYAAYDATWLSFDEVEEWFGEGENQTLITIDFVEDETAEEVTFAWGLQFEEENISAHDALIFLTEKDENLEVTFNDISQIVAVSYHDLEKSATGNKTWRTFIGTSMSDYTPVEDEVLPLLEDGDFFGISFGGEKVRRPFIPTIINASDMGLDSFELSTSVKVWPNPTTDKLFIESDASVQNVMVFDMMGRKLMESALGEIDVNPLSAGNYILHIQTQKGNKTVQFIKK